MKGAFDFITCFDSFVLVCWFVSILQIAYRVVWQIPHHEREDKMRAECTKPS